MEVSENGDRYGGVTKDNGPTHVSNINDNTERRLDGEEKRRSESGDVDADRLAGMLYTVEEVPPWHLCILLGLQNCMTCFGANLSVALIIAPAMCIYDNVVISKILGTIFFLAGLVSLLQSTFGTRLPLVQGATFAFIVPTFAILNLPEWKCPAVSNPDSMEQNSSAWSLNDSLSSEPYETSSTSSPSSYTNDENIWKSRMREIQGAIILSSLFEMVVGVSGLVGILVRYIGPLVIGPTITLVGLAVFPAAAGFAAKNWYIAILTSLLIILFSQYLRKVNIPLCSLNENRQCVKTGYPIFTLFPVILGILLSWALCFILTVTNAMPNDPTHWSYHARTDVKISVLKEAAWFRFPYPFQWGIPTFSVGAVFGMLAGVIAGAIESIGDYYSCARLSGAPPPPIHAVNRGIFIEGIGCVLAGMWGSGSGSTTYSENIGAIGITKVASRRVVQFASVFLMLFGVMQKFGALFVTIPDPVIGGVFLVMFGIIAAVGVSNLQYVDLNSSRNLCIFGFSVFFGLAFPKWLTTDDNISLIKTGSTTADQILSILLSTSMFVGGSIGFILDNTIPGTEKERGLLEWRSHLKGSASTLNATASNKQTATTTSAAMATAEPSFTDTASADYTSPIQTAAHHGSEAITSSSHSNSDYNSSTANWASTKPPQSTINTEIYNNISDASETGPRKQQSRQRSLDCYEIPVLTRYLRRYPICRYIPILPTFLEPLDNFGMRNNSTFLNEQRHTEGDVESATKRDRGVDQVEGLSGKLGKAV